MGTSRQKVKVSGTIVKIKEEKQMTEEEMEDYIESCERQGLDWEEEMRFEEKEKLSEESKGGIKMQIKDLIENKPAYDISMTIESLGEKQSTPKGDCIEGVGVDDTGQIKLVLWNEQMEEFKVGDDIIMKKGWCKSFKDELQVSSGLHGSIKKV